MEATGVVELLPNIEALSMLRATAAPVFILMLFLAYTIHSQDVSIREMREYNHEITVYSKAKCSYCSKAIALLQKKKLYFSDIDITWDETRRQKLLKQTGSSTFPQIFIDDKYIGGFSDLSKLSETGELDKMLK